MLLILKTLQLKNKKMDQNWSTNLRRMKKNPASTKGVLAELVSRIEFELPGDYLEFISEVDGCEGMIGIEYLSLWRAEDLIKFNERYHTNEFAPGYFIFGSNLGGTAYAFNKENGSIVAFEFNSMLIDDQPSLIWTTFAEFFESLETK